MKKIKRSGPKTELVELDVQLDFPYQINHEQDSRVDPNISYNAEFHRYLCRSTKSLALLDIVI
jgi:hypothetical protein